MIPVKKIFCPTDFSEPSYEALKTANELALHFSAELTLIHVVSPIPAVPASPAPTGFNLLSYQQEMEASAKELLEQVIQKKISREIKSRIMVIQGNPADEIVRMAAVGNADMIVIATHGLTGWRKFIFGSVAEKVIRLATCPVLSIQVSLDEE